MPPVSDRFSPWESSAINAMVNGWSIFEDCIGGCRFLMNNPKLVMDAFNAATNFDLSLSEAIKSGKRVVNTLRIFNIMNGLTPDMEAPSERYGSTPIDGPAKGIGIMKHWDIIKDVYYRLMGWDYNTGKPLPTTLRDLGLGELISKIWD